MAKATISKEEAQYKIEADARTLVEAEVIRREAKRFKAAINQIEKENAARRSAVKR